jgi:integrase/recombinase XerD
MSSELVKVTRVDVPAVVQAETDEKLLALWLHGRSAATARAYGADARRFLAAVAKPLSAVTLGDLQAYADSLSDLAPASRARLLASVKSLFAFAHRLGYLPFDVARVLRLPKIKATLPERIMSEKQTVRMIAGAGDVETHQERRNRMIVTLLYAAGLRVSELCGLCWRDARDRADGEGQITIHGKGEKTRVVRLPASVWGELVGMRGEAGADDPVFRSRKGGHLDQSQVNRIVHAAAKGAGIKAGVSPHWLRHAHASHSIERGAPIHLVQATLGHASVATTGRYLHARPSESSSKYLPL